MPVPLFDLGLLLVQPSNLISLRVHLYTNPSLPDVGQVQLSDLVEPATPGYSPSPSADWEAPVVKSPYDVEVTSKHLDFRATGLNPGCQVHGWYVSALNGSTPVLVWVEPFAAPKAFAVSGDNVTGQVTVKAFDLAGMPTITD